VSSHFTPIARCKRLFLVSATLNLFEVERNVRCGLSSKSFQTKGWYVDEKHDPVLYFYSPLDHIKTGVEDASETLDSWTFSSRSLIELGLPEK
jgi:hypothetical protein